MSSKVKSPAATGAAFGKGPKLRFPEFQASEGWRVTKLNSLLFEAKKRNRSLELGPADVLSVSGEHGCVNQIEFMGRSYAGVTVKDYHVVEHGDVVYTKSPLKKNPYGIIKENKGKRGIVSTLYAVYRPFPDSSATYLDHFFSVDYNLNAYLQPIVRKGAKNDMKVNNADVLTGDICVPTFLEQKKIADCLDSVDALIAAQGRKVEALRAHKKGLMQQLFPQDGETQPRLRFPEFQNAGEWEFVQLGKLLKMAPDYGVSAAAIPYDAGLPQYLRITDISEDGTYLCENKVSVDLVPNSGNHLEDGDIAIARTGASVGKSYRYRLDDGKLVFAGFLIRLRPDQRKLATAYLAQYMTTGQYWDWIGITSTRSGQPGVNSAELSSLTVPLPADDRRLREQQRIADCLTSVDDLIATEARKLGTLKIHKKGLMQQLFPQVGETDA